MLYWMGIVTVLLITYSLIRLEEKVNNDRR